MPGRLHGLTLMFESTVETSAYSSPRLPKQTGEGRVLVGLAFGLSVSPPSPDSGKLAYYLSHLYLHLLLR
jgi:hypothetical protein